MLNLTAEQILDCLRIKQLQNEDPVNFIVGTVHKLH